VSFALFVVNENFRHSETAWARVLTQKPEDHKRENTVDRNLALEVVRVTEAAASRCLGGDMQARLKPRNQQEVERIKAKGIREIEKRYSIEELARGEVVVAASGVTDGDYLKGVRFFAAGATTQSVVMRSKTCTIRMIDATHTFALKPEL